MSHHGPFRAPLFVPADRPERFAKAAASGADAVIVDLEDAVAEDRKDLGREGLSEALRLTCPVIVRINGLDAPAHDADIAALRELPLRLIMAPKVEDAVQLREIGERLGGGVDFIALIESARGVSEAQAIARAPGVRQIAFGSADYALDMGIEDNAEAHGFALSTLALAARAAGLPGPLDAPCFDLAEDGAALAREAALALRLGACGKLCIHPRQVGPVKAAFAPSAAQIAAAQSLLAGGGDGAARQDGRFVDRPVRERARKVLDEAYGVSRARSIDPSIDRA